MICFGCSSTGSDRISAATFSGCLPFRQLTETLLAGPDGRVNDLEEELSSTRIENEDRAVDWLRRQVTLEGLVNRDSVDIGVIHEPDDLVGEQLTVVLRREIRLGGFGRVELETLSNSFSKNVHGRVRLHDLRHRLLDERLAAREPMAVSGMV